VRHAISIAGLNPMNVGLVSCARCHSRVRSGQAGSPSTITIEARTSSAETSAFHIIHAVLVYHSSRLPAVRFQLRPMVFRCSTSRPPWPWTMALGGPVVPEENSTVMGWSNGTGSNASGPGSAIRSVQAVVSGRWCGP
jgi:hypothetical protein